MSGPPEPGQDGLRPLDLVRSIKVKLGLLVVASVIATALLTWYGLVILGFWPRYTLPVAVLLSLGVTQVLAHGMTSPLRRMTAAARIMAAGGSPPPLHVTTRDEVGELARAFTAMAEDLDAAQRQRRELLANVGHEIRTPVAALRAQLENLVDGVRPVDGAALEEVLGQALRVNDLLEDLLDLARAEGGGKPLQLDELPVEPLVDAAAREISTARPGTVVQVDVEPGLVATADPRRLRQVLANLLDNAARHASSGAVDVVARTGPRGGLELTVSDDGPGIPPEQREAVFGRFETGRAPGDPTSGETALVDGGTGLGLAIARWAVALHGGRIDVLPTPSGCHVRVLLPSHPPVPAAEEGVPMTNPYAPPRPAGDDPAGDQLVGDDAAVQSWHGPRGVMPVLPAVLVAVCGLLGATVAVGDAAGLGLSVTCLVLVGVALACEPRGEGAGYDLLDRVLLGLAAGLCLVPAVRDNEGMVVLSLLGGAGILAAVAVRARTWPALVFAAPAAGLAALFGLPWAGRRLGRLRRVSSDAWSWVRTVGLTVVLLLILGWLLGSADAIFNSWLETFVPDIQIQEDLAFRLVVGGLFALTALGGAAALASSLRWGDLSRPVSPRHVREWLLPVVVTDVLLLVFILLQAARLFPGLLDDVALPPGQTLADQAHQGFGQLVAVTLVIVALTAWAGRRCGDDPAHRRLLGFAGGALVGLGLLVVVSALARLLNYEEAYGWTVLRLLAGLAELWLALVLLLVAASWWRGVADRLPRLVLVSAGAFLLVTALTGPDAVVAWADVARFEQTGKIDTAYLSRLSDDAVPALAELPADQRRCALGGREPAHDGFWQLNASRAYAAGILEDLGLQTASAPSSCPDADADAATGAGLH